MKHLTQRLIVCAVGLSSAACQHDGPAPVASTIPLASYSAGFQARAAEELAHLPKDSAIGILVADYGKTRRAVCAAEIWHQTACRQIQTADGGAR